MPVPEKILDRVADFLSYCWTRGEDTWARDLLADLRASREGRHQDTALARVLRDYWSEREQAAHFYARWVDALSDVDALRPIWAKIAETVRDRRIDDFQNALALYSEAARALREQRPDLSCRTCGHRIERPGVIAALLRDARAQAEGEDDAAARDRLDAAVRVAIPWLLGRCSERCLRKADQTDRPSDG